MDSSPKKDLELTTRAEARRTLKLIIAETLAVMSAYKLAEKERARAKREAEIQAAMARYFGVLGQAFGDGFEGNPPSDVEALGAIMRTAKADAARAELIAELRRIFVAAYVTGAGETVAEIGLSLTTGFNEAAARWAKEKAGTLITEIDAHTLEVVRSAVSDFITTPGATLQDIIDRLPFGEERARLVGITESTAAFAEGNQDAAEALAKKYPDVSVVKTWLTNNDDRVCSICGPLDRKQVAYDESFTTGIDNPPAHPGCRCTTSYRTNL